MFAGALMKRHAGFGPLGTGGVYAVEIDPATGQAVSGPTSFLDLTAIGIPTGVDPHTGLPAVATPNTDPNSWDAVGKISIGDMDMSGDDERLWVMNLSNQTLYSIYLGHTGSSADPSIKCGPIFDCDCHGYVGDSDAASCAAGDVRPWAVEGAPRVCIRRCGLLGTKLSRAFAKRPGCGCLAGLHPAPPR